MSVEDCGLWSLPWTLSRLSNGGKQTNSSIIQYENKRALYRWPLPLLIIFTTTITSTTANHFHYQSLLLPLLITNGTKINSLLYAVDLIIFSRSKIGLQNCLNTLHSYCKTWRLKIKSEEDKNHVIPKTPTEVCWQQL